MVMEMEQELQLFHFWFATLKGIVEIVLCKLNKGLFYNKLLLDSANRDGLDFVLCMGDDISGKGIFHFYILVCCWTWRQEKFQSNFTCFLQ